MSLLWPPITTPQLGGVIVVTFFEKMIHCRAREKTNFWRPWRQELWKRQRWIGILVNWGCFLQKYELLLGQYSKISNQWNFLEKDTNFCWIFYVMQALNKKSSKSLCLSPRNSIGWKFLNIGPVIVHTFVRNTPNLQVYQFTSVSSTALGAKVFKYLFSL